MHTTPVGVWGNCLDNSLRLQKIKDEVLKLTKATNIEELRKYVAQAEQHMPSKESAQYEDAKDDLLYLRGLLAQWKHYQIYNGVSRGVLQFSCDDAASTNQSVWSKLTDEEHAAIQEALNSMTKYRGESVAPLMEVVQGIVNSEKDIPKYNCLICGERLATPGALHLCIRCRSFLLRCGNSRIEEEQKKYEQNLLPENTHWLYTDEETKRKVMLLLRPGESMDWYSRQPIYMLFHKNKKKNEDATQKPFCRCLVCGGLSRSDKGLCESCRQYLEKHGCTIPMPYSKIPKQSRYYNMRSSLLYPQNEQMPPLRKVR